MRIVIHCRDRFGITLEILATVVKHRANLSGIELGEEKLYLRLPGAAQHTFLALQEDVLNIEGVLGVEKVAFMPKEREHFELNVLMTSLERPIVSIDDSGRILFANPAAESALTLPSEYSSLKLERFLGGVDLMPEISNQLGKRFHREIRLAQTKYTVDIFPVDVQDWRDSRRIGAVLCFRPQSLISSQKHMVLDALPKTKNVFVGDTIMAIAEGVISAIANKQHVLISGEESTGKETLLRYCLSKSQIHDLTVNYLHCDVADLDELDARLEDLSRSDVASILVLTNIEKLSNKALNGLQTNLANRQSEAGILLLATVTASHGKDVSALAKQLYCKALHRIHLPALRQRTLAEKHLLADHYLQELAGTRVPSLAPDCAEVFETYAWPGNCLELQASLHHAVGSMSGSTLTADLWYRAIEAGLFGHNSFEAVPTFADMQNFFEQELLTKLHAVYPTTRKLARRLGLSHTAVANKLRKYKIADSN